MSYYTNNRQVIKSLKLNTGTAQNPSYTDLCCASERTLNLSLDSQDFSVFCDALKRHVTTGADVNIATTLKLDAGNAAMIALLGNVHSLIKDGTIAQFNNLMIQFELLSGYTSSTLTYTTYNAYANLTIESIGGAAEDVTEVSATFTLNGTATPAASA